MASVTDRRLAIRTEKLVKAYLVNGVLPDEARVEEDLKLQLGNFLNAITGEYKIEEPIWLHDPIAYRETSDYVKWNLTQASALEDIQILYADFTDDARHLTDKLYETITATQLARVQLQKLMGRIENLLLLSNDADGFIYSFFDTFADQSKISYTTPYTSSVLVNADKQQVELALDLDSGVEGVQQETEIANLIFLQNSPSDISVSFLNNIATGGIRSLSNGQLTDIFNNKAIAWQKEVELTGPGPLQMELIVRIAPLAPIQVNKIELETKMTNPGNGVMIQVQYSLDGISYKDIPSASNPQYVGQGAVFNFSTISATHIKFLVTKNMADNGKVYNIGFQYINFVKVKYLSSGDLYSIPITLPDNRNIGKVACEVCEIKPEGTDIEYSIVRGSTEVKISPTSDSQPKYSKIIDIGSLTEVEKDLYSTAGNLVWTADGSGHLSIDIRDIASDTNELDLKDPTILQTITLHRNIGPNISSIAVASGVEGYWVEPAHASGYFQTYGSISNEVDATFDSEIETVIIDNRSLAGVKDLTEGIHKVAIEDLDALQNEVTTKFDYYFARNAEYVSPFDFLYNYGTEDLGIFTYDASSGLLTINAIPSGVVVPKVDYEESFEALTSTINPEDLYKSSGAKLTGVTYTVTNSILEEGDSIVVTVGTNPRWVDKIDLILAIDTKLALQITHSLDNINYTTDITSTPAALPGTQNITSIRYTVPIYTKYIKVTLLEGSGVIDDTPSVYPPVFKATRTIKSLPIYLPTGNTWSKLIDNNKATQNQALEISNAFSEAILGSYNPNVGNNYQLDISSLYCPKLILTIVSSDVAADPYVDGITLTGIPLTNEHSKIFFSYNGLVSENIDSIRFRAHLIANSPGIAPVLQSYRVKLLG